MDTATTAPPADPVADEREPEEAPTPEPDAAGGPGSRVERRAASSDSSQEDKMRRYVVLERADLAEFARAIAGGDKPITLTAEELLERLTGVEVLSNLGTYDSRNTEHALRQAAKQGFPDVEHARPTLIPVAETYWRPTPVIVKNERTVTVG